MLCEKVSSKCFNFYHHFFMFLYMLRDPPPLCSQVLPHVADILELLKEYLRRCKLPDLKIKGYSILKVLLMSMGVGMSHFSILFIKCLWFLMVTCIAFLNCVCCAYIICILLLCEEIQDLVLAKLEPEILCQGSLVKLWYVCFNLCIP